MNILMISKVSKDKVAIILHELNVIDGELSVTWNQGINRCDCLSSTYCLYLHTNVSNLYLTYKVPCTFEQWQSEV